MKLNQLTDNPGARKERMRIGRGIGSGKGKTGGRGVKGQKARTGVTINGFEGGQTPLHRRLPKIGFRRPFPKKEVAINVSDLQRAVDKKKLDIAQTVDMAALRACGLVSRSVETVRILGRGTLTAKINLRVDGASASAVAAVEKAGGSVTIPAKPVPRAKGEKKPVKAA